MSARPSLPLDAAAQLFRKLRECNRKAIAKSGDINVSDLADCIERALEDESNRRGIMLAISEFVGTTLDGGAIDLATWKPLARLIKRPPRR